MNSKGVLHFFCGKMASGKSTLAAELVRQHGAILISEDAWLSQMYPDEIKVFADYLRYSARIKPLLKSHVQSLLNAGVSVVMDFPGNTEDQRAWFKEILSEHDFPHRLHYIDLSDELCIEQLKKRSANLPEGSAFTTEKEFHLVNGYFQPPSEQEGYHIKCYARDNM